MQMVYRKDILLAIIEVVANTHIFYEYQIDMFMLISVALDGKHRYKRAGKNMKKTT
jgi:hypothetical protein